MTQFIVIEQDSDDDIIQTYGNFRSVEEAMQWLKDKRVPEFTKYYESHTGRKTNVGFYGNSSAVDSTSFTRWQICFLTLIDIQDKG